MDKNYVSFTRFNDNRSPGIHARQLTIIPKLLLSLSYAFLKNVSKAADH